MKSNFFCLQNLKINACEFWASQVDDTYTTYQSQYKNFLQLLRDHKDPKIIFLAGNVSLFLVFFIKSLGAITAKQISIIVQEYNYDFNRIYNEKNYFKKYFKIAYLWIISFFIKKLIFHTSYQQHRYIDLFPAFKDKALFITLPSYHLVNINDQSVDAGDNIDILIPGHYRDFEVLNDCVNCLSDHVNVTFHIVTRKNQKDIVEKLFNKYSDLVKLYIDIPKKDYLALLKRSYIVIIPLKASGDANGQLVLLDSYALKKPIVCTSTVSLCDYYNDDSVRLYKSDNEKELTSKVIELLNDSDLRDTVANNGFAFLNQNINCKDRFVKEIFRLCNIDF